jgi:hypothetical protein
MDLIKEIDEYKAKIRKAQEITDPDERQYRIDGLKRAVILVCSCTAYQDQTQSDEFKTAYEEILSM